MSARKCNKCNGELDRHGCPRCDDPVMRLEQLRLAQIQLRQDLRSGVVKSRRARKREGAYFFQRARLFAEQRRAEQAPELPLSGQDAALPVGDRS